MIRRFGAPPKNGVKYTIRPGAYAILKHGSDMLVTHQSSPKPEYQLPGGGVDAGESPVAALYREVFEETGWTITRPRRLGAYRRFVFMPDYDLWAEKICFVYVASPARRISPPTEPHHAAVWLPDTVASGMLASSGDRHFVKKGLS